VTSPDHPVTCVCGHDAVAFAEWASKKYKRRYRLPTSVEWEIIARAGTRSAFSFGDDEGRICEYARFADAGTTLGRARRVRVTCPPRDSEGPSRVASLKPNAWGFFDTVGNAWEWTRDCRGSPGHARAAKQAQSTTGECAFSLLGGGWNSVVVQLRPGHRDHIQSKPHHRTSVNGFRLAADVD
jgi:formylglycine-generating enzyme required for sulfatase activity